MSEERNEQTQISEILIEALDYLSKLGKNLNIRSENLKENRLQNSKLLNFHAVKKVSNKVLKICELSKKSLDNVEDGISKVLNICSENSNQQRNNDYFVVRYKNEELRIPGQISYKHYQSCVVKSNKLSQLTLDKYPLYFKCKEYKRRKKLKSNLETEENSYEKPSEVEEVPQLNNATQDLNVIECKEDTEKALLCKKASTKEDSIVDSVDIKTSIKAPLNDVSNNMTEKNNDEKCQSNEDGPPKPFAIRCVDITKLLPNKNGSEIAIKSNEISNNKDPQEKATDENKPVESEFKPKPLVVTISKLGKIDNALLTTNKLSKVTKYGDGVIAALPSKEVLKKVRFQLLDDSSDSEAVDKAKRQLLSDSSDSENVPKDKRNRSRTKKKTSPLCSETSDEELTTALEEIRNDINNLEENVDKVSNGNEPLHNEDHICNSKKHDNLENSQESNVGSAETKSEKGIKKAKEIDKINSPSKENNNKKVSRSKISESIKRKLLSSSSSDEDYFQKEVQKLKKSSKKPKTIITSSSEDDNSSKESGVLKSTKSTGNDQETNDKESEKNTEEVIEKSEDLEVDQSNNEMENETVKEDNVSKGAENTGKVIEKSKDLECEKSINKEEKESNIQDNNIKEVESRTEEVADKSVDIEDEKSSNEDQLNKQINNGKETEKSTGQVIEKSKDLEDDENTGILNGMNANDPEAVGENATASLDNDNVSDNAAITKDDELASKLLENTSQKEENKTELKQGIATDNTTVEDKPNESENKSESKKKTISTEVDALLESSESSEGENDQMEDLPDVSCLKDDYVLGKLAKEDLLNESDIEKSISESQSSSDEEIKMKKLAKAKKQLLSSSESDSKKHSDKKSSDSNFESDLSDTSISRRKKSKKKRKYSSSSSGSKSSGSESSGVKRRKKKRKRIKEVKDSDESDDGKKSGRKNIRKLLGKEDLDEATKKAAKKEKERLARITERQKMYNSIVFDESSDGKEKHVEKVVLDYDADTKEPLIEVDKGIVKKLKPHQANGIKFMWDACFESLKQIKKSKGSGCILAHCMGLGKTLQVVALVHTLMSNSERTGVNRVLVVCPLSTVLNWVNEFNMWVEHAENNVDIEVFELSKHKTYAERASVLKCWYHNGGVCVLGYEMFRNLSAVDSKKFKKKMLTTLQESLVDPGPDLIVCDEGHLLKNEKTSISQAMSKIRSRRRIVLTGTPLQNNLKEYYCMVQFVKPNLLGNFREYLNRFVNPITNGQYVNSTERDISLMKKRSHVLHKMLDGSVQRQDYAVLAPYLPPKHEFVVFVTLSDIQIELYQFYLDNLASRKSSSGSGGSLFADYQALQRIWTHPYVLKLNADRQELEQIKKYERGESSEGSLVDFIDDDESTAESETSTPSENDSDDNSKSENDEKKNNKEEKVEKPKFQRKSRSNPDVVVEEPPKPEEPSEWWKKIVTEEHLDDMRLSHKLLLLFEILKQCESIGDKVLVFSQSLFSLDLIEYFLEKIDEATQAGVDDPKLAGHKGSWAAGLDYFRLDGSISCENRSTFCKRFNRESETRARLFLISTRAGGLGINLYAANRVIIFDVSWNPSHDIQSIFRVYRFGQKKPCYIYRFLAMGTMEEKIYERQVTKQAISKRVIDEQQIDRHYAEHDLQELYSFTPKPSELRSIPNVPKDRLFAEMLKENEMIYKYHEHDSLLENKEEETLTEEERRAAWEDFENEKNRPPPPPPQLQNFTPNIQGGLVGQQYQAVLTAMRTLYPQMSQSQLNQMVPIILQQGNQSLIRGLNTAISGALPNAGPSLPVGVHIQRVQRPIVPGNVRIGAQVRHNLDPARLLQKQMLHKRKVMQRQLLARPRIATMPNEVVDLNDSD